MTLKEIAVELKIPESTLRLYRDEFEEFVPCTGHGRRRRYNDEGFAALQKIVDGKRAGWAGGRIREELARDQTPREKVRRRTTEERLDEALALLTAQAGEIAMLRAEVGALRSEVTAMLQTTRVDTPLRLEDLYAAEMARR